MLRTHSRTANLLREYIDCVLYSLCLVIDIVDQWYRYCRDVLLFAFCNLYFVSR